MTDDWRIGDPFANPNDPEAAAREQRRQEREERRRREREARSGDKGESDGAAAPAAAAPPPPPPDPPVPPRTPEQEFWDEEPATPPAAPPPRRRRLPTGAGSPVLAWLRRHLLWIAGALAALVLLWLLVALFQPFHGDGSGRVAVTIPKGASVSEVGDILDDKGVVSSSTLFQPRVTIAGKRSDLYPGRFVLAHDMSYGAAIDELTTAAGQGGRRGDHPGGIQPLAGGAAGRGSGPLGQLPGRDRPVQVPRPRRNTAAGARRTWRASSFPTPSN